MPFLADFHSHLFSRTLFDALSAASPLRGSRSERTERVTRSLGVALPSADDEEHMARWLDEMERHGVSHLVSFASTPEETSVVEHLAPRARGRITFFAFADPRRSDARSELVRLFEQGSVGGALFFPALHRYRLDGDEVGSLFEVLDAHAAPAVVHCGLLRIPLREHFGLPHGVDLTLANPLHLVGIAERYPSVSFVIPHFGAGFLRETLMAGAQCPNIFVDTSSSQAWLRTDPAHLTLVDVLERTLASFGARRILFGTDSSVFPRGWRRDLYLAQREALGALGVAEEDRARIMGMNAAQLLRLSP